MGLRSWLKKNQSNRPEVTRKPIGTTCEFIGLPGSGKHIMAPIIRDELHRRGWCNSIPKADYSLDRPQPANEEHNRAFGSLLPLHIDRLQRDGCQLPHLSEYVSHTAQILSWCWNWEYRSPTSPSLFLNESLLHHFGSELCQALESSASFLKSPKLDRHQKFADFLGPRMSVILTTAPRMEILRRLDMRRGQPVHWDWAQAYGDRLEEFLDKSQDRLETLVYILKSHGVRLYTIEVVGDSADDMLALKALAIAKNIDMEACNDR